MSVELPAAARALVKKLAPGWTHHATAGRGHIEVSHYGDPRADGTRPTLTREEEVDSVLVRLCHQATRRAVVALWVQPTRYEPTGKLEKRWHTATTVSRGKRTRVQPPLLALADPAAVALLSVLLRYKRSSWSLDFALRGRHAAEHTPQRLDAAQLTAYVTATSPAEYAQALDELAAKRAATTAKAAATRAARLSTSVATEVAA